MKFTAIVALALSAVAVSAKCHPKKIAYLEDNVKHPAQLCQFWLRGHIDRNYSPLPNLNGHQLTNVCECLPRLVTGLLADIRQRRLLPQAKGS